MRTLWNIILVTLRCGISFTPDSRSALNVKNKRPKFLAFFIFFTSFPRLCISKAKRFYNCNGQCWIENPCRTHVVANFCLILYECINEPNELNFFLLWRLTFDDLKCRNFLFERRATVCGEIEKREKLKKSFQVGYVDLYTFHLRVCI